MELKVYDTNLRLQGIGEGQKSLIWIRRCFDAGEFEAVMPLTARNVELFAPGRLVMIPNRRDAGLIEDIEWQESRESASLTVRGRKLAAWFARRVTKRRAEYENTPAAFIMEDLAGQNARITGLCNLILPLSQEEAGGGPWLTMADGSNLTDSARITTIIERNIYADVAMTKIAKAANLGFDIWPNLERGCYEMVIYTGTDRSAGQSQNSRVIFADEYGNLTETVYRLNRQNVANMAYARYERNEKDRFLEIGDTSATYLDRLEIAVDATDISADVEGEASEAEKQSAYADQEKRVRTKAQNTLNAYSGSESMEGDTRADGNFAYLQHYDLGDVITVRKTGWGMEENLRITEIQESYENGGLVITPTLGNPLPTAIDWGN